jgi:hypothetical protein
MIGLSFDERFYIQSNLGNEFNRTPAAPPLQAFVACLPSTATAPAVVPSSTPTRSRTTQSTSNVGSSNG